MDDDDYWWGLDDISRWLNIPVATLRKWRTTGTFPPGFKIGRRLYWPKPDVIKWWSDQGEEE